jgi:hypothetical protein
LFTGSDYYGTVNVNPNVPKFASGNRAQATAEENKAAAQESNATFGTYAVSPDSTFSR